MSYNTIVFIGAGRVATQLGKRLVEANTKILQVYSRSIEAASALANITGADVAGHISDLTRESDLYIISIADDAIEKIAGELKIKNKIVVHTSGSVPMNVLSTASARYGVFYPLQTFAKDKDVDFSNIPICIEGSNNEVETTLLTFGKTISRDVRIISSQQRLFIHIAAVYANNFSNFMYLMAEELLEKSGVSFDVLIPLISETANKIKHTLPRDAQTGPAIRGDKNVLQKHLELLKDDPEKREIYKMISSSISSKFR